MIKVLIIYNQTANPLSYLSGTITVAANGTTTVPDDSKGTLSIDGAFRSDCSNNIVQVSDGTTKFGATDAIRYLDTIPGLTDKDSRGITSTTIVVDSITHQAVDVNMVEGAAINISDTGTTVNTYNEVTSVTSSVLTTITTYTAPVGKTTYLLKSAFAGTNIAAYDIRINNIVKDKKYTHFGLLTNKFIFNAYGTKGLLLTVGDVVIIKVIHNRPFVGDFNARIETIEI